MTSSSDQEFLRSLEKRQASILNSLAQNPISAVDNLFALLQLNDPTLCCLTSLVNENPLQAWGSDSPLCQNPEHIRPLGPKGKVGVPYLISLPGNTSVIAKFTTVDELIAKLREEPPSKVTELEGHEAEVGQCVIRNPEILKQAHYIGLDEFTNETLIAYILNYMFESLGMNNRGLRFYLKHYAGTACGDPQRLPMRGINLIEWADYGTLVDFGSSEKTQEFRGVYRVNVLGESESSPETPKEISLVYPSTLLEIIKQLTIALHFVQRTINFSSGDLKAANIFVSSDLTNGSYQGISCQAPFTCKIGDYGKSACTLYSADGKPLRFYNTNPAADLYLKWQPFHLNTGVTAEGDYFYRVNNTFTAQTYTRSRHMGIPYYQSFDLYTVLMSILMLEPYHYSLFGTPELKKGIWDLLWVTEEDGNIMKERLDKAMRDNKTMSISYAIEILKGVSLRCDAVERLLGSLRKIKLG